MATRTPPPIYTATAISYYDYYPSSPSPSPSRSSDLPPLPIQTPSVSNDNLIYINGTAFPTNSKYARFFNVFPGHYPPSFERYIHREVEAELYATESYTNILARKVKGVEMVDVEVFVVMVVVWFMLQWIFRRIVGVFRMVKGASYQPALRKLKGLTKMTAAKLWRMGQKKPMEKQNGVGGDGPKAMEGKRYRKAKPVGREKKQYTIRGDNNGRVEVVLGINGNEDVYEGDGSDVEDVTAMKIAQRRKGRKRTPRSMWKMRGRLDGYGELTTPY